jgi:hypothetical protein
VRPPIGVLLTVSSPTVKGEINLISISLLKRRGKAGRRWAHFPFKTSSPMTSIPAVWMNLPSPRGFYATNIKAASARARPGRTPGMGDASKERVGSELVDMARMLRIGLDRRVVGKVGLSRDKRIEDGGR